MSRATDVTRRVLLRRAALGALALASGVKNVLGQTASSPPNIVFILADDLGYADVSCYGRPAPSTPNIDRIATNGVRFLRQPEGSAERHVRSTCREVARVERDHVAGDR